MIRRAKPEEPMEKEFVSNLYNSNNARNKKCYKCDEGANLTKKCWDRHGYDTGGRN